MATQMITNKTRAMVNGALNLQQIGTGFSEEGIRAKVDSLFEECNRKSDSTGTFSLNLPEGGSVEYTLKQFAEESDLFNAKHENSIDLSATFSSPNSEPNTSIGTATSSFIGQVLQNIVVDLNESHPLFSNIPTINCTTINVMMDIYESYSGFADPVEMGQEGKSDGGVGYIALQISAGMFEIRTEVTEAEITTQRQAGTFAQRGVIQLLSRAVANLVFKMVQTKQKVIIESMTKGYYDYSPGNDGSQRIDMGYNPASNGIFLDWGEYDPKTNNIVLTTGANPFASLQALFTNESIPQILLTKSKIVGYVIDPYTQRALFQYVQNNNNPISFQGMNWVLDKSSGNGASSNEGAMREMLSTIAAWTDNKPFYVMTDTFALETSKETGAVSKLRYKLPPGTIIPLFANDGSSSAGSIYTTPAERSMGNTIGNNGTDYAQNGANEWLNIISNAQKGSHIARLFVTHGSKFIYFNPFGRSNWWTARTLSIKKNP